MKGKIVVIGSTNTDMTAFCDRMPLPGETVFGNDFVTGPGGKGANQAVAAKRLGGNVSLSARLAMTYSVRTPSVILKRKALIQR